MILRELLGNNIPISQLAEKYQVRPNDIYNLPAAGKRYHRTIHEECLMTKFLIDLDDARKQIAGYIAYYNTKRLHSSLHYLTPDDFLNNRISEQPEARNTKLQLAKKARQENGGQGLL